MSKVASAFDRRGFLGSAAGAAFVTALGPGALRAGTSAPDAVFLVPGYEPSRAYAQGAPLLDDPVAARAVPAGYDDTVTMLSRIEPAAGTIARALFPLAGHSVAIHPDGRSALFSAMNGPVSYLIDTTTLDVAGRIEPHGPGYVFGGHAVYLRDRGVIVIAERRDTDLPFTGSPADHYGRLSVRDAASLRVLEVWDCQGIAPHDLALTEDGTHVVAANYGSTAWPEGQVSPVEGIGYGVEPCVTAIDVESGALRAKIKGTNRKTEVRHVAAHRVDRIVGLQVRATSFEDAQRRLTVLEGVYERDISEREGLGYLPVPLLLGDASAPDAAPRMIEPADPLRMIRGQSIVAAPVHAEANATFTTSHTIAVVGGDGALRRLIATDELGLRWPRGIALLPDGLHYAVAGDWQDLYIFRRGEHTLVREACVYATIFGHSHLTAI